ncbi:peptidase C14 [Calocera cornea HHB12733]|uniref:Peptidase C14 n=1 Tax=Calocera cornea HHB12733 TaxID=1353952 RepID=A0A165D7X8_9BASI|nr:peptidase C14 [Calocera cornea HHB12733]
MPYVEPSPSHWHALLIAIAYQSHPDDRARLDQPHADVHLMRELLTKKGYPPENIVVLSDEKSSPPGAQPTKENILNALSHFYDPVLPPSDPAQSHKFFFYYAGHGAQEFDKTLTEDDWLNECIVPLGSRVLLALGLMEPEPEMYWAGACTGSRPRPLDPGEAGLVHSPPASPTVLVPALLPLPSLASLPSPPTTTSHPTHPSQPNAAHPPRRKLTKPKRRQSSIKFLPSDCPFGMEPVDLPPRTRGGDGSAGAGGVGGAQGMPGAYGAGFPAGGPEQGQGQGQGQLVLPVVTGEHGWINDDTLCDLLCRRLPENCKLIAVFDMCHSGTALDLPKNYTWEDVPWLHLCAYSPFPLSASPRNH